MPAKGDRQQPTISVIVTTRNSAETLGSCLDSIRAQTFPRGELIVVDNSSTDRSLEIARQAADIVEVYGPERSAQRNRGARLARGRYLLFVDSDMVLSPEVTAECVDLLDTGASAVVVPELSVGTGFWARCRVLERSCYPGDDDIEAARGYPKGRFMSEGGFDETLTGPEDWDASRRIGGTRGLPRTQSVIIHNEGRFSLSAAFRKRRYYAPGYRRYLRKHGRAVMGQGNLLIRGAFIRNWRRLAAHPILTAGMITLKLTELAATLVGGLDWRTGKDKLSPYP